MGAAEEAVVVTGQWGGTNLHADGSAGGNGEEPGGGEPSGEVLSEPGAIFSKYITNPGCHSSNSEHTDDCYTVETNILTWDDLKLAKNGTKYGYAAATIKDDSIRNHAFYGCTSLTSIVIPDNVTTIGDFAFRNCTNLKSINLPDSLTSIGVDAFMGCTSLTSINLPASVTSIEQSTFENCTSLNTITFDGSVSEWNAIITNSSNFWNYRSSIKEIVCSDGTVTL